MGSWGWESGFPQELGLFSSAVMSAVILDSEVFYVASPGDNLSPTTVTGIWENPRSRSFGFSGEDCIVVQSMGSGASAAGPESGLCCS